MLKKLVDISLGKLGRTTNTGLPENLTIDMVRGVKEKEKPKFKAKRKSLMPDLMSTRENDNYQTYQSQTQRSPKVPERGKGGKRNKSNNDFPKFHTSAHIIRYYKEGNNLESLRSMNYAVRN